jgi:type I restriction enzyme, S subunit
VGLRPYTCYKPTNSPWVGDVPEHWGVHNLRALVKRRNERNRPKLPLLSVARERGVFVRSLTDEDENHNAIPEDLRNYKVAPRGSLVINKMKAWQGSMGIAPCDGIVSPAYFVFDLSILSPTYGQALLRSKPYIAHFAQASDGVRIGQWDLSIAGMNEIPVVVPSEAEQELIARFITYASLRIDKTIHAKRRMIVLLDEHKQTIANEALTRGVDPGIPLQDSGIPWLGQVPGHWKIVPLKSVCTIQSGITLGKYYLGQQLIEYPYLRVANVQAGRLHLNTVKTILLPDSEARRSLLRVGDVLMTEGGDPDKLGRGCVWNGEIEACLHQNHVFAVRPSPSCLRSYFLSSLIGAFYAKVYFLRTAKQTTNLASTNKATIGRLRLPLPDIEEQARILSAIENATSPLSAAIRKTEREINCLQEYRTRLIADVVTGKLDVRTAASCLRENQGEQRDPISADDAETFEDEEAAFAEAASD